MDTNVSIVNCFLESIVSISERLRAERERLGLSQEEFAALAGAHRKSQGNYEKGDRQPDAAYLAAIAAAGADVLYILTGQHSGTQNQSQSQAQRDELTADVREAIRLVADELAAQHKQVRGAQFLALVERTLSHLKQGRALERAEQGRQALKTTP